MSGGSFLGEMKNLGISLGKDLVRESAPLVKDMLKKKIQKRLSSDMGSGLYASRVGRGRRGGAAIEDQQFSLSDVAKTGKRLFGKGREPRVKYPGEYYTADYRPGDRHATAEEIAARRGGAAIEDQQFSLSDVAKTGRRLFGKGSRMHMSAAQLRTLKKGGMIQIKPAMLDEAGRYAMTLKPQAEAALDKALSHSKGLRIAKEHLEDLVDLKRGGSLMGKIAMAVAPMLVEKVVDSIVKRTGGAAIEDQQFSLSDVAKTGKRLFGKGLKGKAKKLYGEHVGEVKNMISEYGDDALGLYNEYAPGLRAKVGMGVIQTGSPYQHPSNVYGTPMRPFIPKNPYV
jgi:hypothetical protein